MKAQKSDKEDDEEIRSVREVTCLTEFRHVLVLFNLDQTRHHDYIVRTLTFVPQAVAVAVVGGVGGGNSAPCLSNKKLSNKKSRPWI